MNIKKTFLSVITFFIIFNAQVVYTKESQDDNNSSRTTIPSDLGDMQYNEEIWKFIEETFQTVTDQTQKVEFCLQTIEQIINAGKIKFDTKKISKSEILQEIKSIKQMIQMIAEFYTKQLPKDEGIMRGTFFNTAFIEYLLPVFKNDITTINVDEFDKIVAEKYEQLMNETQDAAQLPIMIENNEANLKLLMEAGDNVGLSTFNKWYRYLDTNHVPWYGKSTIATVQDIAFWGGTGLLVYCTGLYWLTTKETTIPGTWKIFDKKKFEAEKAKAETDQKQAESEHNDLLAKEIKIPRHPVTWMDKGKEYTRCTAADLPLKGFVGSIVDTKTYGIMQDDDKKEMMYRTKFGFFNKIHEPFLSYTDPFIAGIFGTLGIYTMPKLKELYKSAKKEFDHTVNYYFKGDISPIKSATDIPKTYFRDMIGGDHLEKLARELTDYLKNPTRYERAGISPSTGYLLVGPSQTGKSFFAKALKTLVDDEFQDTNDKVKFAIITADDLKYFGGFTDIFYWARKNAPIILFMDEIDMFETRRDRNAKNTQELLTAMNGIDTDPSKKVIVIAATNKPEELDFALKQKGRLGTVITFDFPTYECRKQYLEKQLDKKNIYLSPEMIDTIAQETDGQTYNMIDDIIRQALQLATFQTRPVEEADFEITLDREIRKIKPNTTMSAQEKELVAIYQAGQAAARHVLATDQQIVKITIDTVDKPIKSKEGFGIINEQKGQQHENHELLPQARMKPTRLGFVFTMSKTNNHELLSDDDQERELMALLSGQAALELIKGSTFNEFGKEDRAKVLDALEKKISQGTPITDKIRQQAIAAKDALYQKAKAALQRHVPFIKTISDQLLKNNTINTKQWLQIAANYKI